MKLTRGNLIYVNLGEHPRENDSRQSGTRMCVIVSNEHSRMLSVCPCTSKVDKKYNPVHVSLQPEDIKGYSIKPSLILVEQTVPVDRRKVLGKIGFISNDAVMKQLDNAIALQCGIKAGDSNE